MRPSILMRRSAAKPERPRRRVVGRQPPAAPAELQQAGLRQAGCDLSRPLHQRAPSVGRDRARGLWRADRRLWIARRAQGDDRVPDPFVGQLHRSMRALRRLAACAASRCSTLRLCLREGRRWPRKPTAPTPPRAQRAAAPRLGFAERVFGYDVFVSFALGPPPRGTRAYAADLARRLREADFTVFFSEDEAPAGGALDATLRRALLRSRTLVVVLNRGTLAEPRWVRTEVETFRQAHPRRPVVPVSIGGAITDPRSPRRRGPGCSTTAASGSTSTRPRGTRGGRATMWSPG